MGVPFMGMALETITDTRYVRVRGQRCLALCYDRDTGDVVATGVWPVTDISIADPTEAKAEARRLLSADEYQLDAPGDDAASWPTLAPCMHEPNL
jgi:hypothetical protein